ncbi:MAG: hypothetical protein ACOYBO_07685 [Azonexus sp.]
MSTPTALLADLATLRKANNLQAQRIERIGEERRRASIGRLVDRATLDALALVTLHVGGGEVRRDVAPLGQRRWAHAVALLRFAGLAQGRYVRLQLLPTPQATLQAILDAAAAARRNPALWARYMPAYNRPRALHGAR